MRLNVGTKLGCYEIPSKIGEGGMGEYESSADKEKESGKRNEEPTTNTRVH